MAKIYDYKGENNMWAVLEDPRVGSNDFFLYDWKHDKTTLSPVYNKKFATADSVTNGVASSSITTDPAYGWGGYCIQVEKDMVKFNTRTNTSDTQNMSIPDGRWLQSMDVNLPAKYGMMVFNNGTSDGLFVHTNASYSSGSITLYSTTMDLATAPLEDIRGTLTDSSVSASYSCMGNYVAWYGEANGRIYGHSKQYDSRNNGSIWREMSLNMVEVSSWPSSLGTFSQSNTYTTYYYGCLVGRSSVDNNFIFADLQNSNYSRIIRFHKRTGSSGTTRTEISSHSNSNLPAGGTNAGGSLFGQTTYGLNCMPSRWWDDPRDVSGDTKVFYHLYFDSNGDYHPVVFTWDTTNDTFASETDVTITGDKSSVHADWGSSLATLDDELVYSNNDATPDGFWYQHIFDFNGQKYVTLVPYDTRRSTTTNPLYRTWITYSIDASDPKQLTYHSTCEIPTPYQNSAYLNDEKTLWGLFDWYSFRIYAFNAATGWQTANVLPYPVYAIGRDRNDRIWFAKSHYDLSSTQYPELNLLTPTLPISVTISPELESYTYSGSNINTYVDVSAYNAAGDRIQTDVKLLIEGSGMTFDDSSTVKTVTSSALAELQVPIIITSAGFANITASVDI